MFFFFILFVRVQSTIERNRKFFLHFSFYVCSCLHLYGQLTVHKRPHHPCIQEGTSPQCPLVARVSHILTVCVCKCSNKNVGFKLLLHSEPKENSGRPQEDVWTRSGTGSGPKPEPEPEPEPGRLGLGARTKAAPPFCNLLPLSMCASCCWKNNVIHVLES